MRTKIYCLLLLIQLMTMNHLVAEEQEILFLSAPRSGTHWALYCLCSLLKRNVIIDRGPAEVKPFNRFFGDQSEGWIYAAHNPKDLWIKKNGDENDILILILRNYRECFLRNLKSVDSTINELRAQANCNWMDKHKNSALILHQNYYFNNLRCYHLWNPEKRFLIYYEDLIDDPEAVLNQMATFFNIPNGQSEIKNFMQNIEEHKATCLKIYSSQGGSESKGKDNLYHSKKWGLENCILIDNEVKELFPQYFAQYLSRYEIQELCR